jgi:hypothetical protein
MQVLLLLLLLLLKRMGLSALKTAMCAWQSLQQ